MLTGFDSNGNNVCLLFSLHAAICFANTMVVVWYLIGFDSKGNKM
jgi:hypothetical protein